MTAPISVWSAGSVPREARMVIDRIAAIDDVARIAVMPDVHLAGEACVGSAIATRTTIFPWMLGSDLGCGVAATPLGVAREQLRDPARILAELARAVPTHRGRPVDLPLEVRSACVERVERDARSQLGTLGRGNHFLEIQADEHDALWLMVHSGSRAVGPAIQAHHARAIEAQSDEGRAYLDDLAWALAYARANRRRIAERALEVLGDRLGARSAEWLECHHDAVAREEHGGELLWVHRKGAVAADEGATVLVPGSMGTASFHAIGRGHPEALRTSAHGAGRALARGEARRKVSPSRLAREMEGVAWDARAAAHLVEEAPAAYKDVDRVMRAQRELVRIVRRLQPVLVHKGT